MTYYQRRKERFAQIVADHTPMHVKSIRIHRRKKGETRGGYYHYEAQEMSIPRPVNLDRLVICLHECGHVQEHHHARFHPVSFREYLAEEYVDRVLNKLGMSRPSFGIEQSLLTLLDHIKEDIDKREEIYRELVAKLQLSRSQLVQMGASDKQIPWMHGEVKADDLHRSVWDVWSWKRLGKLAEKAQESAELLTAEEVNF
jgi:hypothetical protein